MNPGTGDSGLKATDSEETRMNGAVAKGGTELCHEHNLPPGFRQQDRPFGIRVSLPSDEPLRRVLGGDWHTEHWYTTEAERERALADMLAEHVYSRFGDRPRIACEKVGSEALADRPRDPARVEPERPGRRKRRWWRR